MLLRLIALFFGLAMPFSLALAGQVVAILKDGPGARPFVPQAALEAENMDVPSIAEAEKDVGLTVTIETIHEVLSSYQPLDELIIHRMPKNQDPLRDIVFITRAGALFPIYRTSSLLEQLKGKVIIPSVLFYPGTLDGAAGLCFMGVLDAEHNYRPKIF